MKSVRVQYTVQPSYADTNKANIRKVMDALTANPIDGLIYFACTLDDGETFVHTVIAPDDAAQKQLSGIAELKAFQAALKESGPVSPPSPQNMNFISANFDV